MSLDPIPAMPQVCRICFVSTGNIRRSPLASAVLRELAAAAGRSEQILVSSAGTGDWYVGEPSDGRLTDALVRHGSDRNAHRSRQFDPDEFPDLDLVVVFDHSQERIVKTWAASESDRAKVKLLHLFDPEQAHLGDLPDPCTGNAPFDAVVDRIERACAALLGQIEPGPPPRD